MSDFFRNCGRARTSWERTSRDDNRRAAKQWGASTVGCSPFSLSIPASAASQIRTVSATTWPVLRARSARPTWGECPSRVSVCKCIKLLHTYVYPSLQNACRIITCWSEHGAGGVIQLSGAPCMTQGQLSWRWWPPRILAACIGGRVMLTAVFTACRGARC